MLVLRSARQHKSDIIIFFLISANDAYEKVKDQARDLLEKAKAEYATLQPEEHDEFKEVSSADSGKEVARLGMFGLLYDHT